jgi:PhoPQ-activated pathogenicity-related protein
MVMVVGRRKRLKRCAFVASAYAWHLVNSFQSAQFAATIYNIHMTSQHWLNPADSSIYQWEHWVQVCVPHARNPRSNGWAFIYIDGGDIPINDAQPPATMDAETPFVLPFVCQESGGISAAILDIPNEPAYFPSDWPKVKRRTEDAVIAFTWRKFFNDTANNANWLLRLPMTKAVVRAMDTVEAFAVQQNLGAVSKWVVAGASKRGWTTWTTMAVDPRIKGAVPIVMPILNTVPNVLHQFQLLGGYSFALSDYADEGCIGFIERPEWAAMNAIVDPYTYISRYNMPKLLIAATGDEFFPPDSLQWFLPKLLTSGGGTLVNLVPDAEHSLATGIVDAATSASAFYHLVRNGLPVPNYTWQILKGNKTAQTIVQVDAASRPYLVDVQMWKATTLSTSRRDFRLVTCTDFTMGGCFQPVAWWPTTLHESAPGQYVASSAPPIAGWSAFNVQLIFEYPDPFTGYNHTLTVTTEINTIPDTLPFKKCSFCNCGANCGPLPGPVGK